MMEQICLPHRLTADKRLRPKLSSATSFIRKMLCVMLWRQLTLKIKVQQTSFLLNLKNDF